MYQSSLAVGNIASLRSCRETKELRGGGRRTITSCATPRTPLSRLRHSVEWSLKNLIWGKGVAVLASLAHSGNLELLEIAHKVAATWNIARAR